MSGFVINSLTMWGVWFFVRVCLVFLLLYGGFFFCGGGF